METDRETLLFFFSASLLRSAKITAGVVSLSSRSARRLLSKLVELAVNFVSAREGFLLIVAVGGGGGAVGGRGGFELLVAGGMFPGSTVTRVAGFEYRFPLS